MDPRIERKGLTPERRTQAMLTARSIIKAYGPDRAMRRVDEISATRYEHTPGNKAFYALVRKLVTESLEQLA